MYSTTAFVASLSLKTPHISPAPSAAGGSPDSIAGNGNDVVSVPNPSFASSGQNPGMKDACLCMKQPGLPLASLSNIGSCAFPKKVDTIASVPPTTYPSVCIIWLSKVAAFFTIGSLNGIS